MNGNALETLPPPITVQGLYANHPNAQLRHQGTTQRTVDHRPQIQQGDTLQSNFWHRVVGSFGSRFGNHFEAGQDFIGVLAGLRSRALGAARSLRHDYHWTELAHFADLRVMHAAYVAIVQNLRMVQRSFRGHVRFRRHIRRLPRKQVHPVVQVLFLNLLQHYPFQ